MLIILVYIIPIIAFASIVRADKLDPNPTFVSLQRHKSNYFISGDPDTKIQVSFKLPLLRNYDLYFSYSQIMFWDLLKENSSPFADLNVNPEIFYRFRFSDDPRILDLGVEHQSNGQEGNTSRSWNKVYVYAPFDYSWGAKTGEIGAKCYHLFDIEGAGPLDHEIRQFQGFMEMQFVTKNLLSPFITYDEFYAHFRPGMHWDHGPNYYALELGLRFKLIEKESAPHFFIQYYNGYGEKQLNFNQHDNSIRAGISL